MQQTSHLDSGRGTDQRDAAPNEEPGSPSAIPIGTSVRSLDRFNAKGSFDRGQSQARRDHARWRRGIAQRAGRGNRRDPASSKQRKGVALAWLRELLKRKSPKLGAVALANTNAAPKNCQTYQHVARLFNIIPIMRHRHVAAI
jgi:hypothetical protein